MLGSLMPLPKLKFSLVPLSQPGAGGREKIVGKGSARRGRETEEPVVFKAAAYRVVEAVAYVARELNGIAVVAALDRAVGDPPEVSVEPRSSSYLKAPRATICALIR